MCRDSLASIKTCCISFEEWTEDETARILATQVGENTEGYGRWTLRAILSGTEASDVQDVVVIWHKATDASSGRGADPQSPMAGAEWTLITEAPTPTPGQTKWESPGAKNRSRSRSRSAAPSRSRSDAIQVTPSAEERRRDSASPAQWVTLMKDDVVIGGDFSDGTVTIRETYNRMMKELGKGGDMGPGDEVWINGRQGCADSNIGALGQGAHTVHIWVNSGRGGNAGLSVIHQIFGHLSLGLGAFLSFEAVLLAAAKTVNEIRIHHALLARTLICFQGVISNPGERPPRQFRPGDQVFAFIAGPFNPAAGGLDNIQRLVTFQHPFHRIQVVRLDGSIVNKTASATDTVANILMAGRRRYGRSGGPNEAVVS